MITYQDVVDAWDVADPKLIHPYREVSESAYWAGGIAQAQWIDAEFRTYGLGTDESILDYGCGDGRVALPMARLGWSVVPLDSSPRMRVRLAEMAAGLPVDVVADARFEPVGAAYCLAVLIHHGWADAERIIATIRDAVRPGGLVLLDWPLSAYPRERETWIGVTTWSPEQRAAAAARLGLELLADSGFGLYRRLA